MCEMSVHGDSARIQKHFSNCGTVFACFNYNYHFRSLRSSLPRYENSRVCVYMQDVNVALKTHEDQFCALRGTNMAIRHFTAMDAAQTMRLL